MFASVFEWIYSYFTNVDEPRIQDLVNEVTLDYHSSILQCGVKTRLCSIKLNNAREKFTTWHKNNTQIIREGEEEFHEDEWVMLSELRSSGNVLDIVCLAKQPGTATVKLDLGTRYKFVSESEFSITVQLQPSYLPAMSVWGRPQGLINQKTVELDESETLMKNVRQNEKQKHSTDSINQTKDISDSYVELMPELDGLNEQPLFPGDDHFKCLIHLPDDSQNASKSFSPNDLTVCQYKKRIADVKIRKLSPGLLQAVVPLKNVRINEKGKAKLTITFGKNPIPLDLSFTVYQTFDEETCKTMSKPNRKAFQCENVSKSEIIGEDSCHLKNIARVCCIKEHKQINVELVNSKCVRVILPLCDEVKVEKCRKILLHLLRAIYYRKKASEMDKERKKWKKRAEERYKANKLHHATFCKHIKTNYANLMQSYHNKASEEIFEFLNVERGLNHVDLHGLLVVDEETLARDKEELLKDKPEEEVINIINKRRDQGDEAMRMLKKKIVEFMGNMGKARREKKTWLEVIVGAGHHSVGRQKIQPKVEEYLKEEYPDKVSFVNEGSLVVTFEEYPNNERCFGHYYCQTCKEDWKSGKSYKNKWQGCIKCYKKGKGIIECFPVMQSPLNRMVGKVTGATKQDHFKDLCQVCRELGSCM